MSGSRNQFPSKKAQEIFRQKVQAISSRPQIYTPNGTFQEVILYINAFIDGAGYPTGEINLESGMAPFARWLLKVDGHKSYLSQDYSRWEEILLVFCKGDEQFAISSLGTLYEEYLSDTHD
ncbi:hypothetical protein Pan153_01950 [Gimesia panareensis]|uniref:Uncharacterized protein n=1 Tax=Gimesia panareensis TaxID=2527978 RepID=A0A518FGX1_9PLAN|nr:hypothetical protein [Gimesia panareensis]QDV15581.1 hypothetical protein Pan153_01950 [Gimesia panareensis]